VPPRTAKPGRRRTGRARRGPAMLSALVHGFMASAPVGALVLRLGAAWERALPARVVRASSPVRLRGGVLEVHTTNSAWAQELVLLQNEVLPRLRFLLPDLEIASLRARVGPFPKRTPPLVTPPPRFVPLPESELPDEVRATLAAIADERLRAAIRDAACASLSRTRARDEKPPDPLAARRVRPADQKR
jgi:hypothetical protein